MEGPLFRVFGCAYVAVEKLFVCVCREDGTHVRAWSDHGAPVDLEGDDALSFVEYLKSRRIPERGPGSILVTAPQWAPYPDDPSVCEDEHGPGNGEEPRHEPASG